jgi:hypothetical protein
MVMPVNQTIPENQEKSDENVPLSQKIPTCFVPVAALI